MSQLECVDLYIKYIDENGKDPKELAEDYFKLQQMNKHLTLAMEDKQTLFNHQIETMESRLKQYATDIEKLHREEIEPLKKDAETKDNLIER